MNKNTLQHLKPLLFSWLMVSLLLFGCKEELETPTIDPNMNPFEITTENLVAPAKVGIKTNFATASQYKWEFAGAYERYDLQKKEYSFKLEPDTLLYEQPGTYKVSLTYYMGTDASTATTIVKEITVGKPTPRIDITAIKLSPGNEILLSAANYWVNPDFETTFSWELEGAPAVTGKSISTVFNTAGKKKVKLSVFDGKDTFVVENDIEIKVPTPETQAKTIYYTDMVSGFIYAKIVPVNESLFSANDLAPRKVCAIPTDRYIMGMNVDGNDLVISDAGTKIGGAVATDVSGEIYKLDITKLAPTKTVMVKQGTFNGVDDCANPFAATVSDGNLYTVSRLYNLYTTPLSTLNANFTTAATRLPLRTSAGATIVSIQGGVQIIDNYAYVSNYSHTLALTGIWKHDLATGKATSTAADIQSKTPISAFVIDGTTVYYVTNPVTATGTPGNNEVVKCNLDGTGKVVIATYQGLSIVPNGAEPIGTRSLVLDKEGGMLYWCIRPSGGVYGNPETSGIVGWKTDGSASPKMIVPGVVSFSMALDQTLR